MNQDEETQDMADSIMAFYKSLSQQVSSPAVEAASPRKQGAQEEDSMTVGGASTDIIDLSRLIARSFNLPDPYSRQILNIFFESAPGCLYDIWS